MTEKSEQIVNEAALSKGDWYVYAYTDPRLGREGQRIYIGMAQTKHASEARRMREHWNRCERHQNKLFSRILAKIKRLGLQPLMEVVAIFATAEEAKTEERRLIALYGKRIGNTGTLCNVTSGGDGSFGLPPEFRAKAIESVRRFYAEHPEVKIAQAQKAAQKWTPEKRAEHSAKVTVRLSDPLEREKISRGQKANERFIRESSARIAALNADADFVRRRSDSIREAYKDPVLRAKFDAVSKSFWNSEHGTALKSKIMTERWKDPAYRARQVEMYTARWQDAEFAAKVGERVRVALANQSPEQKAAISEQRREAAKRRWANPEWKARTVSAMTKKPPKAPKSEHGGKALWRDPAYRERILAARAAAAARPDAKVRRSETSKAVWAQHGEKIAARIKASKSDPALRAEVSRKTREYYSDPAKRAEAGAFAAAYNTPEVKARKAAEMKARWADPEFRAGRALDREMKLIREAIHARRPTHMESIHV